MRASFIGMGFAPSLVDRAISENGMPTETNFPGSRYSVMTQ